MNKIYLVRKIFGCSFTGDYSEQILYTTFDEDDAIYKASMLYRKHERSLLNYDLAYMTVVSVPVGVVNEETLIWHSHKDMEFNTIAEILESANIKPRFSLLWDDTIPSDFEQNIEYSYMHKDIKSANDPDMKHPFVLQQESELANDMEWELFNTYELKAS